MTSPIRPGDLVIVVREHCEKSAEKNLGRMFVVNWISNAGLTCHECGARLTEKPGADAGQGEGFPVAWLKRIDPPAEQLAERRELEAVR